MDFYLSPSCLSHGVSASIIRPRRAAGNAGTVPNGSNRNGVQNQAVEMNPLAGSTADVLGYTQVRQAYVSPRSYGNELVTNVKILPW